MSTVYAVLLSIGDYSELNIDMLPTWKMDLVLMNTALISGLKIPAENIRTFIDNDEQIQEKYFRKNKDSFVKDGIYIWTNSSYDFKRKM